MSHSVRSHLRLDIEEYDESIRRFIPGYESMLARATEHLLASGPRRVLDVGAGTGALAGVVLEVDPRVRVELLDIDPEMLDRARGRLSRHGERVAFREGSYEAALPPCDGACASLSLHHVPSLPKKTEVYRRIFEALPDGGVFVNADAVVPADGPGRDATFRSWADHLVASGIPEEQAWRHFEEWAEEDTYFPLEDELAALGAAGFETECLWQEGPMAVLAGRRRDSR